jgi:hypothetical protein
MPSSTASGMDFPGGIVSSSNQTMSPRSRSAFANLRTLDLSALLCERNTSQRCVGVGVESSGMAPHIRLRGGIYRDKSPRSLPPDNISSDVNREVELSHMITHATTVPRTGSDDKRKVRVRSRRVSKSGAAGNRTRGKTPASCENEWVNKGEKGRYRRRPDTP